MLYWCYEGLVIGLDPCGFVAVSIREVFLVIVDGHWHIYRLVIYSGSAHSGILLYCIVLAGFLLGWLSTWLVILVMLFVKSDNIMFCSLRVFLSL